MNKIIVCPIIAISVFFMAQGCLLVPVCATQASNSSGLVGPIASGEFAPERWQNRPIAEYQCLEAHDTSAQALANKGISPNDPRIRRLFAQCSRDASAASQGVAAPTSSNAGAYNPAFAVGGLAAGGAVDPDSDAYMDYSCRPSTDYPGFQWCARHRQLNGASGPFDSDTTIFHSPTYTAAFVLEDILPAFFAPGDAEREIQRLSKRFGQSARIFTGEPRPDASHSVIATWGDVTLTPLDPDNLDAVARGKPIHVGLVIDFLGDTKKSAAEGMPIYRIGGGEGYIWSAKYDDSGKGRLRLTSVNASLLPGATPDTTSRSAYVASPTPVQIPIAAPDPAKIEADRAARSGRAIEAANAQLEDAQSFVKEHPQSPQLLDYVERMGAVAAAVKAGDPDDIERKSTELSNALNHDQDYPRHQAELAETKRRTEAQYLGDALRQGEQQRAFIMDYIGKNPLSDATPALANLVKQLVPILRKGDLAPLRRLVDEIGLAIREANLQDDFVASQSELPKAAITTVEASPAAPSASVQLPKTEKNGFLLEGKLDDVEILYNASPSAPHIAQNLRGDFVFAGNQASVCLFGANPDGFAVGVKKILSAAIPSKTVAIAVTAACDPDHLLAYDLVATQRGAFLQASRSSALSLIKAIENDDYKPFAKIAADDIDRSAQAERASIERIKTIVADGAPDGFGIVIAKTGSPNLCVATADKTESHRALLLRAADKIGLDMRSDVVLKAMSVEEAFVGLQRRQCGAVYASASNLKVLTAALTRNGAGYALSSLWLTPAEVDQEDTAIAQQNRLAAEQETQRAQRNADQTRLAAVRAKDFDATRTARQAALRAKFGDSAKAAASALGAEIIAWARSQQGPIGDAYPGYAAWLASKLSDHWEIMTTDSALQDFGTSNFKGRSLDTVFSRITLHLKNRILGEYGEDCFIFGRIDDAEFGMERETVQARCDDGAAIAAWQTGHRFASEWTVAN